MFWHVLAAPVKPAIQFAFLRCSRMVGVEIKVETKMEIVQTFKVEQNEEEQSARGYMLQQLWVSYIKNEIDVTNPIQMKAANGMKREKP